MQFRTTPLLVLSTGTWSDPETTPADKLVKFASGALVRKATLADPETGSTFTCSLGEHADDLQPMTSVEAVLDAHTEAAGRTVKWKLKLLSANVLGNVAPAVTGKPAREPAAA
jgi:hypothetical protein